MVFNALFNGFLVVFKWFFLMVFDPFRVNSQSTCPRHVFWCQGLLPATEGILNPLGHRYVTIYVDALGDRNHLLFYDTTELGAWKLLSELHANWEHVAGS